MWSAPVLPLLALMWAAWVLHARASWRVQLFQGAPSKGASFVCLHRCVLTSLHCVLVLLSLLAVANPLCARIWKHAAAYCWVHRVQDMYQTDELLDHVRSFGCMHGIVEAACWLPFPPGLVLVCCRFAPQTPGRLAAGPDYLNRRAEEEVRCRSPLRRTAQCVACAHGVTCCSLKWLLACACERPQ